MNCSGKFEKQEIRIIYPNKIAKIEGKYALLISPEEFPLNKKFTSEDCESWAVELPIDNLFRDSITNLLKSMFNDLTILNKDLVNQESEINKFTSLISLEKSNALATFVTERNTGKFNIKLNSQIVVKGSNKEIKNNINSEQSWERNIYLGCELSEGSKIATENAFENFLEQVHSSVYQSVYKIIR
tara:strand:- start:511 stop:1068 length:558 start_codon:yes stop_codon:yes gene_type:complete